MDMKTQLCALVSDEDLRRIATAYGLGSRVTSNLSQLRAAICGDQRAAAFIERAAPSGCACKGKIASTIAAHINTADGAMNAGRLAFSRTNLGGGGQGVTGEHVDASGLDSVALDWNCRRSSGDLAGCDAGRIMRRHYPKASGLLVDLEDYAGVSAETLGLEEAPIGTKWYIYLGGHTTFEQHRVAQQLCIHDFSVTLVDLIVDDVDVVPEMVAVATEEVVDNGEDGAAHVFGWPVDLPRKGYRITEQRCRCVVDRCVFFRVNGRYYIAFALPELVGTQSYRFVMTFRRTAIAVKAGPCPPELRCKRPVIVADPCGATFDLLPDPGGPAPEPEPEEGVVELFEDDDGNLVDAEGNTVDPDDFDFV